MRLKIRLSFMTLVRRIIGAYLHGRGRLTYHNAQSGRMVYQLEIQLPLPRKIDA
jgi:hypothetical protein